MKSLNIYVFSVKGVYNYECTRLILLLSKLGLKCEPITGVVDMKVKAYSYKGRIKHAN